MGGGPIVAMTFVDALDNLDINVTIVLEMALSATLLALHVLIAAARSCAMCAASPPREASLSTSSSSALTARIVVHSFNVVINSRR